VPWWLLSSLAAADASASASAAAAAAAFAAAASCLHLRLCRGQWATCTSKSSSSCYPIKP
jgi:hypothetical protein